MFAVPNPYRDRCNKLIHLVGYKIAGRSGAIAAMMGVVLPSFIITLIATFFSKFQDNETLKRHLWVFVAVVKSDSNGCYKGRKKAIRDKLATVITIATVVLILILDTRYIYYNRQGTSRLIHYLTP